jgi:hypothetical protein
MGSLYGDLPQAKTSKDGEGGSVTVPGASWAPKFTPNVKKSTTFAPPPSVLRAAIKKPVPTLSPVTGPLRKAGENCQIHWDVDTVKVIESI